MTTVRMFKMPFESKKFNLNQKVFVRWTTGDLACAVVGRFRGNGRWVTAWVNWGSNAKAEPVFKEIEVDDEFAKRLRLTW